MAKPLFSIVMPVLNEDERIHAALMRLQALRDAGVEVIVVDGGSHDETVALATPLADQVITAMPGRGAQMNAGAAQAQGRFLLFLHADTELPANIAQWLGLLTDKDPAWGYCTVRLSGNAKPLRVVEWCMNARSRITRMPTGDQMQFVRADVFRFIGGFADIPLMEDIHLAKRLRWKHPPFRIESPVVTSSRRWEQHGMVRTVLLMWWLRLQYAFGVSPYKLARQYRGS
ncbi:MAG TPA: TIGR04283 family arsenosugar biosynthesis glycosyltransferase [Pseudomonadales bacterium]